MPYLDHNATSPLRPEARAAIERAWDEQGNPSSVHRSGRAARSVIESAREDVARLVNARPAEVIFTSGGTEANALALWGAVEGAAQSGGAIHRLCISAIEHDSVLKTSAAITDLNPGVRLETIPVTRDGVVDVELFRRVFHDGKGRALVAVMAANNETGVVQPVADVIELVRNAGSLILVDAVQACGKVAADFAALDADYLALSAHKIGGPQGVGALVMKEGAPFAAQTVGGGQERTCRAGTENVAGIAGFGAAARAIRNEENARLAVLRDGFEENLRRRFADVVIFGTGAPRLANTSNFALPRLAAETALISLDLDGVMVSSGSACSSGKVKPSQVLRAMGVPQEIAASALRVSLGWNSSESDIEAALDSLDKLSARVTARRAA